jgi:uncharacterized membrane protein YqhA
MKRWALLTVGLYMLILLLLAGPLICMCFMGISDLTPRPGGLMDGLTGIYVSAFDAVLHEDGHDRLARILISPWVWALVMGLAQAALLVVPVRVASRRPVTTRWLIWPALAALIMLLLLAGGILAAVWETIENTNDLTDPATIIAFVSPVGVIWLAWAIIFGYYTVRGGRANFMNRLARSLVAGSILELLVAVPAHVLARARNYCCAGFGTFWGIAAGISVMLFAFGPAVFVLFARRYGGLRRPPRQAGPQQIAQAAADADADISRP